MGATLYMVYKNADFFGTNVNLITTFVQIFWTSHLVPDHKKN